MSLTIAIVGAIFAIFVIILIHELGHFSAAKWLGVVVEKFSIGFGRPIWSYQASSGTTYQIGILPLGGYVKMLGEYNDVERLDRQSGAFNQQPLWARWIIVLAGPMMNFILAILLYAGTYMLGMTYVKPVVGQVVPQSIAAQAGVQAGDQIVAIGDMKAPNWQRVVVSLVRHAGETGKLPITVRSQQGAEAVTKELNLATWQLDKQSPNFLASLGIKPWRPTFPAKVAGILPDSPAAKSTLQVGDTIIGINGKAVTTMQQASAIIRQHPNETLRLKILRNDKKVLLRVKTGQHEVRGKKIGYLGFKAKLTRVPPEMLHKVHYSLLEAWPPAIREAWTVFTINAVVLKKMLFGDISVRSLGGPITIFKSAGQASQSGIRTYLAFIAFISITVGFINLLPIPGLDGGHLLFYVIEFVIRRPIPERYQSIALQVGLVLLILLMVQATINDVLRHF